MQIKLIMYILCPMLDKKVNDILNDVSEVLNMISRVSEEVEIGDLAEDGIQMIEEFKDGEKEERSR